MTEEMKSALKSAIIDTLHSKFYLDEKPGDCFALEIYADYRDEMDDQTAGEILRSNDPDCDFNEKMDEWYNDSAYDELAEMKKSVKNAVLEDETYIGYEDEVEEYVDGFFEENVWAEYPYDHFLDQEFYVNIMLDTGDGNYDYVLNSVYPCWYGRIEDGIDDKAGIVWLARQQGYTKTQLRKALKGGEDLAAPSGFLQTMYQELVNLPSHMSTVTFLTKMTLRQLIEVNRALKWCEKNGDRYDARKNPQCGYIVLDKSTMCGLYDPWAGGGSVLEIELEKDVKIPLKFVRSCLPDGAASKYEYTIESVYGMCGSAWKDTVKEIKIPKKVSEAA